MRLDSLLDYFRGQAVTIPPMDGALRPNTALDDSAAELLEAAAPDNLVAGGGQVFYSSGSDLLRLPAYGEAGPLAVARLDAPVSALACSPDGAIAIALDDGRILIKDGTLDGKTLAPADFGGLACPTALAFADAGTLIVCQGSAAHRPSDWVVDLMGKNASGSVWCVDLAAGRASKLAGDLAFPYGVLPNAPGGGVVVAESWRHRLLRIGPQGGVEPLLTKLPGYPARLAAGADGGAWLCLFAPRNRLIEFVLAEDAYRADMMREVAREHWIAPALSSGAGFLEPLQCGGVKTMGIHKPWSPTRSYGLLVRLDRSLRPVASFHSRANGRRHGITSAVERDGRVLVTSKGGNAILQLAVMP
jgi:hypothetical protein